MFLAYTNTKGMAAATEPAGNVVVLRGIHVYTALVYSMSIAPLANPSFTSITFKSESCHLESGDSNTDIKLPIFCSPHVQRETMKSLDLDMCTSRKEDLRWQR